MPGRRRTARRVSSVQSGRNSDGTIAPLRAETTDELATPRDFNSLLHGLRSRELRLPGGARTVRSDGCAGKWYFDWFEENYRLRVARHTDVDASVFAQHVSHRWQPDSPSMSGMIATTR